VIFNFAGFTFGMPLPGEQSIHYLIGIPATALPTSGTFLYNQVSTTSPTLGGANAQPGVFTGALGVTFGTGNATKVGLNGNVAINGGAYQFSTSGGAANPSTSAITLDANSRFAAEIRALSNSSAGPLNCQGATCTARLSGGLFGPGGQTAGFTYRIENNGSITINGVTVFVKP
jgi:trimeric autotransporter adhesin